MRWRSRQEPKLGQERTIKKFLWLPLTLHGETRWLEWSNVVQVRTESFEVSDAGIAFPVDIWEYVRWDKDVVVGRGLSHL